MDNTQRWAVSLTVFLCLLIACTLQFLPFFHGYYLTADDVLFQYFGETQSIQDWLAIGWDTAIRKAKIGEFISIPIMILGNLYIDSLLVRILNICIFLGSAVLFALWVKEQLNAQIALLFMLLFIAMTPLRFLHMPPTSYPFFPSIQIIILLSCLLYINKSHTTIKTISAFGCLLAMLSSEYTLLLGGALILFELTRDTRSARLLSKDIRVWISIAALIGHLVIRNALGTGNYTEVSGEISLKKVLSIVAYHSLNGTILGPAGFPIENQFLQSFDYVRSAVCAFFVSSAAYLILGKVKNYRTPSPILAVAILSFLVILALTVPIALLPKYQAWCSSPSACAYLESRYAGWAVMLILAALVPLGIRKLGRGLITTTIGVAALITSLQNGATMQRINEGLEPWRLAQIRFCENKSSWEKFLESDLANSIPFHTTPDRTRRDYWNVWTQGVNCAQLNIQ